MLQKSFTDRMMALLGEEYGAFISAMESDAVRGVRVNRIKCEDGYKLSEERFNLEKIPYVDNGYILRDGDGIGLTPEHHAGMIYVQDPGAMSALSAIDIHEGEWVLDACAAPGGKSSQIAEKIGDSGFLLSNEYVPKRAKIIVGNFERLGVRNAMVTSLDTAEFPKMFQGVFDLIVCDAPCSGEGMFRKSEEALEDWSEENVAACAKRQLYILENLIPALKAGGRLVYSTCTYSLEENEMTVAAIMERHPEMELIPTEERLLPYTADGINFDGNHPEMKLARRFYPHVCDGEGQFVAVMRKSQNDDQKPTILYKDSGISPTKSDIQIVEKFLKEAFNVIPNGRYVKQGDFISLVTHDAKIPQRSVFMPGVVIGEIQKNILKPHHQLFSAFGKDMKIRVDLKACDARVEKYLRGEEIECDTAESGWCVVCYDGVPLGGGKISSGRVKNHYPKGLRNK